MSLGRRGRFGNQPHPAGDPVNMRIDGEHRPPPVEQQHAGRRLGTHAGQAAKVLPRLRCRPAAQELKRQAASLCPKHGEDGTDVPRLLTCKAPAANRPLHGPGMGVEACVPGRKGPTQPGECGVRIHIAGVLRQDGTDQRVQGRAAVPPPRPGPVHTLEATHDLAEPLFHQVEDYSPHRRRTWGIARSGTTRPGATEPRRPAPCSVPVPSRPFGRLALLDHPGRQEPGLEQQGHGDQQQQHGPRIARRGEDRRSDRHDEPGDPP